MGTTNWPGGSSAQATGSYTGAPYLRSTGFSVPNGRECANGDKPVRYFRTYAYLGGRGASRTASLRIGSNSTSNFTISSQGSAGSTGWRAITADYKQATSVEVRVYVNGSFYFGRHNSSGHTHDDLGPGWSGALAGQAEYYEAPTAPQNVTATAEAGTLSVTWEAPSDDGGTAVTDYVVEWADNEEFAGAESETVSASETSLDIPDLAFGKDWFVRVAAVNEVTTRWSTTSLYSDTASAFMGIAGYRWDGDEEIPFTVAKRWDGEGEVDITVAVRWNGTEEVPLT